MGKLKNLVGMRFGRLTVTKWSDVKNRAHRWLCTCDCGGWTIATSCNLVRLNTQSCGCLHKERSACATKTHGKSKTSLYNAWKTMRARCNNPSAIMYPRYGGRGISVDPRWGEFKNFYEDMGEPTFNGATIDRIDNNGDYCKNNCKWSSRSENARNKENTVFIEWNGERVKLIEFAERMGVKYELFRSRIKKGWSVEDALKNCRGKVR